MAGSLRDLAPIVTIMTVFQVLVLRDPLANLGEIAMGVVPVVLGLTLLVGAAGLRLAVAVGMAVGIALGALRILTCTPLPWYIITGYVLVLVLVLVQTTFAPKAIVALAYDSGGITTSTVTAPLVAAFGLGLSSSIPGRDQVLDGGGAGAHAPRRDQVADQCASMTARKR